MATMTAPDQHYKSSPYQRQACHVAGMALYLIGELPKVQDDPEGYPINGHVCELVVAARTVLPGRCYGRPPLDSEGYAARVHIAHDLILEVRDVASDEVETLLNIAERAISEM